MFDLIKESLVPRGICRRPYSDRHVRKAAERIAREVCKPVGDVLEVYNNACDTAENIEDTLSGKYRPVPFFEDWYDTNFSKGDHIVVQRLSYAHHGIFKDREHVYENSTNGVRVITLKQFADGDVPMLYAEDTIYTQDEIIRRAESRLGESDYNLFINNCQNFATWCRLGD